MDERTGEMEGVLVCHYKTVLRDIIAVKSSSRVISQENWVCRVFRFPLSITHSRFENDVLFIPQSSAKRRRYQGDLSYGDRLLERNIAWIHQR